MLRAHTLFTGERERERCGIWLFKNGRFTMSEREIKREGERNTEGGREGERRYVEYGY
jgi:hypothetical protein